jgi:hypothetical protein
VTEIILHFLAVPEHQDFIAKERALAHQLIADVSPCIQLYIVPEVQQQVDNLVEHVEMLSWHPLCRVDRSHYFHDHVCELVHLSLTLFGQLFFHLLE